MTTDDSHNGSDSQLSVHTDATLFAAGLLSAARTPSRAHLDLG
jgi:hypothetical protein